MKLPLFAALTAVVVLSGCGSRLNPVNWFGGNDAKPEVAKTLEPEGGYPPRPEDRRPLVKSVTSMTVNPMPGGIILFAVGLPPTQGWWDTDLVADNGGEPINGILSYSFVLMPPFQPTPVATARSREVTAARFVPDSRLEDVRQITVRGVENQVSRRR
jgi:hypothetical protein